MSILNANSMVHSPRRKKLVAMCMISASVLLAGCSDDNDSDNASFDVTITNLTAAQPLSPVAVLLHDESWHSFNTGEAASVGLERLAEGGDNSEYLADAMLETEVYQDSSGAGLILPGENETIQISVDEDLLGTLSLSLVSMLVNSNDAIVALNGASLASMEDGSTLVFDALSYDTGTEANTESADSIPGPAGAGGAQEGFNAARDDVRDEVHVHAGVVTMDDGLSSSALTAMHRWDHPVVRIQVTRTD